MMRSAHGNEVPVGPGGQVGAVMASRCVLILLSVTSRDWAGHRGMVAEGRGSGADGGETIRITIKIFNFHGWNCRGPLRHRASYRVKYGWRKNDESLMPNDEGNPNDEI